MVAGQPEDHQAGGEQVEERRDAEQHVRARRHLVLLRELRRRRRVGLRLLVAVPLREVVRRQRERHAEEHEPRLEERRVERLHLARAAEAGRLRAGAASEKGRGRRGGRADLRARTWKSAFEQIVQPVPAARPMMKTSAARASHASEPL